MSHLHKVLKACLAIEIGVSESVNDVGVVQVFGERYLHGNPIRGTLYVLILCCCYDLYSNQCSTHASIMTRAHLQTCPFRLLSAEAERAT